MDFELNGKKAIVSAGGSGIGLSIVEEFIKQGVSISTCDIDKNLIQELRSKYPQVNAEVVDVSDEQTVKEFCLKSIEFLGGLDCLVNNAGVAGPTLPIEEIDAEDWSHCLNVCLSSQFYFVKSCLKQLRKSHSASIVNLSSAAGQYGFALRTPYASAKWGVIGLTKSLSIELGKDKIRVNAILPGLVAGDRQQNVLRNKAQQLGKSFAEVEKEAFSFTSVKEYVQAQDIADQIMYLTSDAGKHISGQAISIDCDTKMLL
jgi:NAD(P)-dependent dehydrogenase (short-subunit alcohol dehydrogenase family)